MGVRIHNLAKELEVPAKELMALLRSRFGIDLATHLAAIQEDVADKVRQEVKSRQSGVAPAATGKPAGARAATGAGAPAAAAAPAASAQARTPAATGTGPIAAPRKPVIRFVEPPPRKQPIIVRPTAPPPRPPPPQREFRSPPPSGAPPAGGPPRTGDPRRKVRIFPGQGDAGGEGRGRVGTHVHRGAGSRSSATRRAHREVPEEIDRIHPHHRQEQLPVDRPSEVSIVLPITLKDLSPAIGVKQNLILGALMKENVLININSHLTPEMIKRIGEFFQVRINTTEQTRLETTLDEIETAVDPIESLRPRAPVVTILGHVDHGKTSLLDKIRSTHVAASEAGGITQHTSAYRVDQGSKHVVFIDTPGHQAFTEMRARGANVTDVVVLVVAADDGVMSTTEEAIQHANAARVPIVVAINKIDKSNANPARVREQLAKLGLSPPEWGGTTEMVDVSARTSQGLDSLLELLSLETEILELRANPFKPAIGTVLDVKKTPGRGIVATVLIRQGTLRRGDPVLCGVAFGVVRQLQSTSGQPLEEAGPATPVEVTGLDDIPAAGDRFYALKDSQKAKAIAEERKRRSRDLDRAQASHIALDKLFEQIARGETKEVRLVLKADVKGTLEVLRKQLTDLGNEEIGVRVIRDGVGEISESDVLLADASDAIVIGFHVVANDRARQLADRNKIEIRTYQVIYNVINEIRSALEGMLAPTLHEEIQSSVEIRQLFKASRLGNIAGCFVRSGVIHRDDPVRVIRDGKIVYEGKLASLKHFKDDAREVKEGLECGIRVHNYADIKVGDLIQSYRVVEKARTLEDVAAR